MAVGRSFRAQYTLLYFLFLLGRGGGQIFPGAIHLRVHLHAVNPGRKEEEEEDFFLLVVVVGGEG